MDHILPKMMYLVKRKLIFAYGKGNFHFMVSNMLLNHSKTVPLNDRTKQTLRMTVGNDKWINDVFLGTIYHYILGIALSFSREMITLPYKHSTY